MDFREETILCRKRFDEWVKGFDRYFRPRDIDKYYQYFDSYIRRLDPITLMQEWRVGSNWKRDKIQKLYRYYEKEYGEVWYPKD